MPTKKKPSLIEAARRSRKKPSPKPEYFEAKPNPLFTELETKMIAFARYAEAVPCAHCGRKSRHHWTTVVPFNVHTMESGVFHLVESPIVLPAFAPVCRDHMMSPAFKTPTAEEKADEGAGLVIALRDYARALHLRGPKGYAFFLNDAWFTTPEIEGDMSKRREDVARHKTLGEALARISPQTKG